MRSPVGLDAADGIRLGGSGRQFGRLEKGVRYSMNVVKQCDELNCRDSFYMTIIRRTHASDERNKTWPYEIASPLGAG